MRCNYHNHTFRCGHACGTEEEYIKKAISEGIRVLGFADHTPYIFPNGHVSSTRMDISEMGDYFSTLLALREKYKGYIDIYIGFETEYYPDYFPALLEEYRKYPLDYLIHAGHYIGHEGREDCFYAFEKTESTRRVTAYVDMLIRAMDTGRFSMLAHPDLLNFVGDRDFYRQEFARLITEAKKRSMPLEINLNGLRDNRYYPREDFWEMAGRMGVDAVLGFDAHMPRHVADQGNILQGLRFAEKFGVNLIDEIKLVNPLF